MNTPTETVNILTKEETPERFVYQILAPERYTTKILNYLKELTWCSKVDRKTFVYVCVYRTYKESAEEIATMLKNIVEELIQLETKTDFVAKYTVEVKIPYDEYMLVIVNAPTSLLDNLKNSLTWRPWYINTIQTSIPTEFRFEVNHKAYDITQDDMLVFTYNLCKGLM